MAKKKKRISSDEDTDTDQDPVMLCAADQVVHHQWRFTTWYELMNDQRYVFMVPNERLPTVLRKVGPGWVTWRNSFHDGLIHGSSNSYHFHRPRGAMLRGCLGHYGHEAQWHIRRAYLMLSMPHS